MSYRIHFVNQNRVISVEGGTMAQACEEAGYGLNLVCGGKGICGKCKIRVKRNGKWQPVLACKEIIEQDEEVYLEETEYVHKENVLVKSDLPEYRFSPSVKKVYRTREDLMPERGGAFLKSAEIPAMRKFSALAAAPDFQGCTFVYYEDHIIDVQEGNLTDVCYGVAVDIGTTTVVCYFYDLVKNCLVNTKAGINKQMIHGADIIARNAYAQESPENLMEMQHLIQNTLNEMIDEAVREEPAMKNNIYHMVLCGNSMMQHFFYGMNPANLGRNPFANITADALVSTGREAQLHCASEGIVEFLPLLGGFVGADMAAVLLNLKEEKQNYIIIDLGTNGEISVGNHNGFFISSTACGPALEGGNIACGMRGTKGAIEKVSLADDEINFQVIGNLHPKGLCGSGIIDAVAELLKVGLIDETGRLLSANEYEKTHPGSSFCSNIHDVEKYNPGFYFTDGDDPVYLCQKDIRQIQLAKSSIYAGCMTLLKESEIPLEHVDALILSGAFGNYIDIDHALFIGLLPPVAPEKIISIGNGAGRGAQSLLLDSLNRKKIKTIQKKVKYIELADHPDFMELFISNINFL